MASEVTSIRICQIIKIILLSNFENSHLRPSSEGQVCPLSRPLPPRHKQPWLIWKAPDIEPLEARTVRVGCIAEAQRQAVLRVPHMGCTIGAQVN